MLSVCMGVRNAAQYITAAVESIVTGLVIEHEVVIVDHGSTDQTMAALIELSGRFHEIRLLRIGYHEGQGPATAKNAAIRAARSDIVRLVDGDDIVPAGAIEEGYYQLVTRRCHGVFGNYIQMDPQVRVAGRAPVLSDLLADLNYLHPGTLTCYKQVFECGGWFDETIPHREDRLWFVQRLSEGWRFEYVPRDWLWYRVHPAGSSQGAEAELCDATVVRPRCREIVDLPGSGNLRYTLYIPAHHRLHPRARDHVAAAFNRNPKSHILFGAVLRDGDRQWLGGGVEAWMDGATEVIVRDDLVLSSGIERIPPAIGIMTQGLPGGGAERSLKQSLASMPYHRLYFTGRGYVNRSAYLAAEARYVNQDSLDTLLGAAKLVIDDGAGRLGAVIPAKANFVQAIRNSRPEVCEAVKHVHPHRVYTAHSLAEKYEPQLRPTDRIIQNGVPMGTPQAKELGLSVVVGRLTENKGIRKILSSNPELGPVIVCGDGPLKRQLQAEYPRVQFVGHVDPKPYYERAEVAVCWSDFPEGYWRVPFEALACGCKVVANRAGDVGTLGNVIYEGANIREAWKRALADPVPDHQLGHSFDERVMQLRWQWYLRGYPQDAVTIGVTYGYDLLQHLDLCLQSLERQTIPVRIVLLHDLRAPGDVSGWLREHHPRVLYRAVSYAGDACTSRVRNALLPVQTPVVAWVDGDCIVPCDGIERGVAHVLTDSRRMLVHLRTRIESPECLPDVLLEPRLTALYREMPNLPGTVTRKSAWATELIYRQTPSNWFWYGLGPGYMCSASRVERFDEAMTGYGGEDCDWSYRMMAAGAVPVVGPMLYHQEHPVQETRGATRTRNMNYVMRKHGFPEREIW